MHRQAKGVIRSQVPEVLRLVGLADQMDSLPDQLSGGEQQRVAVARAMVNRPPLLICDEPTGNLDPAISLGIMKLLERINRTGTTVIVATHDREMVDSMHRRVIALEGGHVTPRRGGGEVTATMAPTNVGYSFKEAISHFFRNWTTSLGAVITIFLSLFIIGLFIMGSAMLNSVIGTVEDQVVINAFISDDADQADVQAFEAELKRGITSSP